jgi:hypothetical protein
VPRRAQPVLEGISRSARALPSSVFGPRDLAPFLRLASARALLTEEGRGTAPALNMSGFLAGKGLEGDGGGPGLFAGEAVV